MDGLDASSTGNGRRDILARRETGLERKRDASEVEPIVFRLRIGLLRFGGNGIVIFIVIYLQTQILWNEINLYDLLKLSGVGVMEIWKDGM
jgi:hypothetical protein